MQLLDDLRDSVLKAWESDDGRKKILLGAGIIAVLALILAFSGLLFPGSGELTVSVKNPEGSPLWKASVQVKIFPRENGDALELSETTDRQGRVSFSDVPVGKEVTVEAGGKGFKTSRQAFTLLEKEGQLSLVLEPEIENTSELKTITFAGPNGVRVEGKLLTVELSCSSGIAIESPVRQVSDGKLDVKAPSGCGTLLAQVIGSGYGAQTYNLEESQVVRLAGLAAENGNAIITVKDSSGNFLDGIEVSIIDGSGIPTGEKGLTHFGEALFSLARGNYIAKTSDRNLSFGSAEQEFSVGANAETKATIVLSEKPIGAIKAKIADKLTGDEVNGRIILESPAGRKDSFDFTGQTVSIPVSRQGTYRLSASAQGYALSKAVEINSSQINSSTYEIEISQCTPSTCGLLKVRVVDEDSKPVQNARVAITDAATGFFAEEYGTRYTDISGIAVFSAVKTGKYKAIVQKFPAEGSQEFEAKEGEEKEVRASLEIGEGTVEVEAIDEDSRPVPFGFAEFRTEGREKLGKIPLDSKGKAAFTTKADKKVFVTVSGQGYTSYTSGSFQLYAGESVKVKAALSKQVLGETPKISLVGIFSETGIEQKQLQAGKTYRAKFKVIVPAQAADELEQLGVFINAGKEKDVQKDSLYIGSVNAPKASVLKGRTYTEPRGTAQDEDNVTNGEAKWASIVWEKGEIRQGIYELEAEIKVRDSTVPGKELSIAYRAYGVKEDGKVMRDPLDAELGQAEEASSKHALYAKAYEKSFFEGALEECNEDFCYSERLLDKKEGVYISRPYSLKIFSDYDLEFAITNISPSVHDNSDIRIKNSLGGTITESRLKAKSYKITNADSRETSSQTDTFEIGPVNLGDLRQNKSVQGKISLRGQELGPTGLYVQIVSDRQQVFQKTLTFAIVQEKDINITILPQTLPAFTPFDLNVEARFFTQENDFQQISDALVRVERTTPDRAKVVFSAATDGKGKALIRIPASDPGTRVTVRVEKAGFSGKTFSAQVSREIVSFRPSALKASLDTTSNTEQRLELSATNLVPVTLHISDLRIRGNFLGLLDTQRMDNWLGQYEGRTNLEYGAASSINVLSAISEDAKLLDQQKKLSGTLVFEVANENNSVKWPLEIPFDTSISLAESPKEQNCIEVGIKEWKDATLGGKAEVEFSIINNCVTQKNKPLDLSTLKAKLEWKGTKLGNVELHVRDPITNLEASEVLSEGVYSDLFDEVKGAREYLGLLVFTPKGGTIGKKAEFNVVIDASQKTNAGEEFVGASNKIASQLDIIDLGECIAYNPDPEAGLILQETAGEGTIEFDSSKCGNVDIDFWLCKGNNNCAGGAEGGIKVSPQQFSLTSRTPKKTVQVSRQEIPGQYGINVQVRTPGSNYREVRLIDVLVKPAPEDAFELYKYEYSLKGKGARDSTELTNRFLSQQMAVDASICDWGSATEKGWWDWKGAGVGMVVGALAGIKPALEAAKLAAQSTAAAADAAKKAAEAAQKASATSNKTSSSTAEEVCSSIATAQGSVSSTTGPCASTAAAPSVASALTAVTTAQTTCQTANEQAQTAAAQDIGVEQSLSGGTSYSFYFGGEPIPFAEALALVQKQVTATTLTSSQMQTITVNLTTAQGALTTGLAAAEGTCITAAAGDETAIARCQSCAAAITSAQGPVGAANGNATSYTNSQLTKSVTETAATQTASQGAQSVAKSAASKMLHPISAMGSALGPGAVMGAYTVGGFMIGGVFQGLFGQNPCDQHTTGNLQDYVINLLSDAGPIETKLKGFSAEYDKGSAKIIGQFNKQRMGVVFTNDGGISSPKPIYATFEFNTKQHLHANPTMISKGNKNFGPFNVPDNQTLDIAPKIHLKFKTQEPEEQLPDLTFDTLSCVSGNKIGRTGKGALPKVKLDWSFGKNGISKDTCIDQNTSGGVYCDATQFSIMLSKRLNDLRQFFEANPSLKCPDNPLTATAQGISRNLNVNQSAFTQGSCFITDWSGYLEGEPTIKILIEANEKTINWTSGIPNKQAFLGTIHFNALLMQDGYTQDFRRDFARHYSFERFFDTPDWFYGLAKDSAGKDYGIAKLFESGSVKFTNRFFESERLSSAGVHEVLVSIAGKNGKFNFFNPDGSVNADIRAEFHLLQEPNPNSAFYSMPFDGLVGLEGDSFNRQGYGVAFKNRETSELVRVNNESRPLKSFTDGGSNPITFVNANVEKGVFGLNASPSQRGNLLSIERKSQNEANLRFAPSKATPVLLKVDAGTLSRDPLSAFYLLTLNETPIDVGSTLTYWDGAGACLDTSGTIITEAFDNKADRAAVPRDPVLNWESAYGVDFGPVNYTGNAYIRTIFYTNPLEQAVLTAQYPNDKMELLTPDEKGTKVPLSGVGGVQYNNPAGGSLGTVSSMADIFGLVENGTVCVVDSGRKAGFFWNPKAVYEMTGKQRNVSSFTNSLKAGDSCIGFG